MDKRINILFGMLGAIVLILTNHPSSLNLRAMLPSFFQGFVTSFITSMLTTSGIFILIYFGIVLIIETLKSLKK